MFCPLPAYASGLESVFIHGLFTIPMQLGRPVVSFVNSSISNEKMNHGRKMKHARISSTYYNITISNFPSKSLTGGRMCRSLCYSLYFLVYGGMANGRVNSPGSFGLSLQVISLELVHPYNPSSYQVSYIYYIYI